MFPYSEFPFTIFELALFLIPIGFLFGVAVVHYLLGPNWAWILLKTWQRDLWGAITYPLLTIHLWHWERKKLTVPKLFQKTVQKYPNKAAFIFEDKTWTFSEVDNLSNKVANYFLEQGYKKGDSVALLLESRPEYVIIWLGLSKIGVVTAFINTNLVNEPLLHSLSAADVKALIFGTDYVESVKAVLDKIKNLQLYQFNASEEDKPLSEAVNLNEKIDSAAADLPVEDIEEGLPEDKLLYIYTSGTTGLPKAAVVQNRRFLFMVTGPKYIASIKPGDIIYDSLPLYHTAGGVLGVGQSLIWGCTVVIKRKFSASNFWKDCEKYNCTIAQYIGEMCRYILAAHPTKDAPKTSVRLIIGNGLKPQIWQQFVDKFNIKCVAEFYGATEGNASLINIDGTVGAVGYLPRYAEFLYPVSLIRCDEKTGEILRGDDGLCQKCQPEQAGVLVGKIVEARALNDFCGYADEKATEKKIIKNVFKIGDRYFNSGDILFKDEFGYYYFVDRTGDTFRWKGENVSTTEVEATMSNLLEYKDVIVYGVQIPNADGRAGMAAILDPDNSLDLERLRRGLINNLPKYAVPIFLRIIQYVPLTGTFKLKKTELAQEGYNIDEIEDKVYVLDSKANTYVELDKERYNDLIGGKMRF